MVALGYTLSFAFMITIMVVGELLQRKFDLDKELTRKCEHILTAFSWVIVYIFVGVSIHMLIINLIACALLGIITFGNFMKSVDREDTEKSYGLFYYGLSTSIVAVIVVFVNPDFIALHGITWFCLALGDGFAPVFAKIFKKKNFEVFSPKTIMGMLGVLIFSFASAVAFNFIFNLEFSWLFMVSIACLATMLELLGKKGFDNFFVEFGVFGYLVLNYYGLVTPAFMASTIIAMVLVVFASKTKALTDGANTVSYLFLLICGFCGGWALMITVASLFLLNGICSKVKSSILKKQKQQPKKHSARNIWQILANCLVTAGLAVTYYVTNDFMFLLGGLAVIGEEFADTMASDFGKFSRRQPIDILRFKRIEKGLSGGVSLIGTFMAFVGATVAMLIGYAILGKELSFEIFVLLCVVVFAGTIIDSILGSGMQALFKCNVCGALVESRNHCQTKAECVKGIPWLNNSMVNFLSGLLTAVLTCGALAMLL